MRFTVEMYPSCISCPCFYVKYPYVSLIGLFIVFWGVMSCRSVGRYWYFRETYFFLLLLWKWRHNIPPKRCYPPNIIWHYNPEDRNTNLDFWEKHQILEFHGVSCTSVRCAGVDSELGHQLPWLGILYFSSVAPGIYLDIESIVPWSLPPKSFPVHLSYTTPHCTRYWPIDTMDHVSLDQLIISHVVKQECLNLIGTKGSLQSSQDLVTGP